MLGKSHSIRKLSPSLKDDMLANLSITEESDQDLNTTQFYQDEIQRLQETRQKILDHPKVRKLLQDKHITKKTLLSKFTILENNFSGVATEHISQI